MQQALQISFHGVDHSDAVEQRIREKAAELERYHDRITSCQVVVETPHQRHRTGDLYRVRIDVHVPGRTIVVGKEHRNDPGHTDVNVAIRDAFAAATRQLEDHAQRRRGQVKRHEAPVD